jgi:hypothetical protein
MRIQFQENDKVWLPKQIETYSRKGVPCVLPSGFYTVEVKTMGGLYVQRGRPVDAVFVPDQEARTIQEAALKLAFHKLADDTDPKALHQIHVAIKQLDPEWVG